VKPRYKAWYGGECPVEPGVKFHILFRDGGVNNGDITQDDNDLNWWKHSNDRNDIIAYRVIEGES